MSSEDEADSRLPGMDDQEQILGAVGGTDVQETLHNTTLETNPFNVNLPPGQGFPHQATQSEESVDYWKGQVQMLINRIKTLETEAREAALWKQRAEESDKRRQYFEDISHFLEKEKQQAEIRVQIEDVNKLIPTAHPVVGNIAGLSSDNAISSPDFQTGARPKTPLASSYLQSTPAPPRLQSANVTLDTLSLHSIPKLNNFSGKTDKDAYPYRRWRYDILQLRSAGYNDKVIKTAISRSCRGTAADLLLALPEDASIDLVLENFQQRFAEVATAESMLSNFYSATQKAVEDVTTWSCRLESILSTPQLQYLTTAQKQAMLRERFWRGLKSYHLKSALRHQFDTGKNYAQLLVAAREIESELPSTTKTKAASQTATSPSTLDVILQRLETLEKNRKEDMKVLETRLGKLEYRNKQQGRGKATYYKGKQNNAPKPGASNTSGATDSTPSTKSKLN